MTNIIDFPKNGKQQLNDDYHELIDAISSKVNKLDRPIFSLKGNIDPKISGQIGKAITEHNNEWSEILMEAVFLTIEETLRSKLVKNTSE